ncbi:MAG: hypothetical protein JNM22_21080 [Saprospiraceae bacterium]|nr:hypothetical protein [Saprospiraceae bacterium]
MDNSFEKIRDLLKNDDFETSYTELESIVYDSQKKNEIVNNKARYSNLLREYRNGTIDYERFSIIKNQIRVSLLDIIDAIYTINNHRLENKKKRNVKAILFLIPSILLVLIFVLGHLNKMIKIENKVSKDWMNSNAQDTTLTSEKKINKNFDAADAVESNVPPSKIHKEKEFIEKSFSFFLVLNFDQLNSIIVLNGSNARIISGQNTTYQEIGIPRLNNEYSILLVNGIDTCSWSAYISINHQRIFPKCN